MAFKLFLYLIALILFIAAISYSDSGASASIQVSATVVQPIGLSSFTSFDSSNKEKDANFNNNSDIQFLLRIPSEQSAICIIETADGQQITYSVTEDLLPIASMKGKSDIISAIKQITVIYTEN